ARLFTNFLSLATGESCARSWWLVGGRRSRCSELSRGIALTCRSAIYISRRRTVACDVRHVSALTSVRRSKNYFEPVRMLVDVCASARLQLKGDNYAVADS